MILLAGACIFGPPILDRNQAPRLVGAVTVNHAAKFDRSARLSSIQAVQTEAPAIDCDKLPQGCGTSPGDPDADEELDQQQRPNEIPPAAPPPVPAAAIAVEQKMLGTKPAAALVTAFDGLGVGFEGPQGPAQSAGRGGAGSRPFGNPSDNSLAVGPNHIVQTVNGGMAVFSKTGAVLYGSVPTKTVFKGFGGACETANFGDVVVRYDQLADRWLYVMPIFQRIPNRPEEPFSMCYALSEGSDPLGPYYRYEFRRKLFPDYPRPAIWPDGYYIPTSTGDNVIQKHACVVDRTSMLKGKDTTEQCLIIEGRQLPQ